MKNKLFLLPVIAGLLVFSSAVAVSAHHFVSGEYYSNAGFPATYFTDHTITIAGTFNAFVFGGTQVFAKIDSVDEKGQPVTWLAEWGPESELDGAAVTRESLRPGDVVILKGNPSRDPEEHRIFIQVMNRMPD